MCVVGGFTIADSMLPHPEKKKTYINCKSSRQPNYNQPPKLHMGGPSEFGEFPKSFIKIIKIHPLSVPTGSSSPLRSTYCSAIPVPSCGPGLNCTVAPDPAAP